MGANEEGTCGQAGLKRDTIVVTNSRESWTLHGRLVPCPCLPRVGMARTYIRLDR
jgi:hypothetical protein